MSCFREIVLIKIFFLANCFHLNYQTENGRASLSCRWTQHVVSTSQTKLLLQVAALSRALTVEVNHVLTTC